MPLAEQRSGPPPWPPCACYCGCRRTGRMGRWRVVANPNDPPNPFCSSPDGYYGVGPLCWRCAGYAQKNIAFGYPWEEITWPGGEGIPSFTRWPLLVHVLWPAGAKVKGTNGYR